MNRFAYLVAVSLSGGVLLGALDNAAQSANVRTVTLSGRPAAGTSAGVTFNSFTEPALDANGQVAFWARLTGTGVNSLNNAGVWFGGSGNLQLVARTGSQAPGMPSGFTFDRFSGASLATPIPRLNATGQIAFRAYTSSLGIWAGAPADLRLVALEGNQAPDAPSGVNFSYLSVPVINAAGQTAFQVQLTGSGVNNTNDYGIWSEGSGSLKLVARGGNAAPGTLIGVNYSYIGPPLLNGAGQTAFWADLIGSGVDSTNDDGIWAERSGALQLIAREADPAPGTPTGVYYKSPTIWAFNTAGRLLFTAGLVGSGIDATNDSGLWSDTSGNSSLVAREGMRAPGTPDGVLFRSNDDPFDPGVNPPAFLYPTLNSAGRISFYASLTGPGVNLSNSAGLWSDTSGSLELVERNGSHAPGTPDGVTFRSVDSYGGISLNAAGQTAFKAYAGVDAIDFAGIWATDVNGILQLIVRTGDTLEVTPSDFRTINDVTFIANAETGTGNDDGRPSAFNDRGQLAFQARFNDGSSGIFVSDAVLNDGALPGDFNKNGLVDGADYVAWRRTYSSEQAGYNIWRANIGRTSIGSGSANNIPEPGAWFFFGVVFLGALLRHRRCA